jgi:hypothetical protein
MPKSQKSSIPASPNTSVLDPDPHNFGKMAPHPDPYQSDKLAPESDPDPHQFADDKQNVWNMSLF